MKQHQSHSLLNVAVFAMVALFVNQAHAQEKYLPPAPIPDVAAATANVVIPPPPTVPTAPVRIQAAPDKPLPQYDTGPVVVPPGAVPTNKVVVPVAPQAKMKAEPPVTSKADTLHNSEKAGTEAPKTEIKEKSKSKPAKDSKDTKSESEKKVDEDSSPE